MEVVRKACPKGPIAGQARRGLRRDYVENIVGVICGVDVTVWIIDWLVLAVTYENFVSGDRYYIEIFGNRRK